MKYISILLLLGFLQKSAQAQLRLQSMGPLVGYTTLQVQPRQQFVGEFPVYWGPTDSDNIRAGLYATFATSLPAVAFRAEVSYVNHSIKSLARNPAVRFDVDDQNWIVTSALHNYKRVEVAPLAVWQHRFWQLHAGVFGWYRFADPAHERPSMRPNRYILYELDQSLASYVGGYKLGGGLTFKRFHAEVNYSHNLTSLTRSSILHQGQPVRMLALQASSFTYDLRYDLYRRTVAN